MGVINSLAVTAMILTGCEGISFDNNPQEEIDTMVNQPELADYLMESNIPKDDNWHLGLGLGTDTDKSTGAKGGHFLLKWKHAWKSRPKPTPSPPLDVPHGYAVTYFKDGSVYLWTEERAAWADMDTKRVFGSYYRDGKP